MKIKGLIISPTGKGVRVDAAGDGHYHAPRGGRLHKGVDLICEPGQEVFCPIDNAYFVRLADPYGDREYSGLMLKNDLMEVKMFYLEVLEKIKPQKLHQGTVIGIAQDITERYTSAMTPHIHLEITSVDSLLFMDKE